MKGQFRNLAGKRYGRLLVVKRVENRNKHVYWLCRCDCGNEVEVRCDALTRGPTVSCGCYQRDVVTTHGMWQTSIYRLWRSMLGRCENPNGHAYKLYGGRGIKVCERWHDFLSFLADMGERPRGCTLDRIDNDGNYEPGNCRWATPKQQGRNRANNRMLTFRGETRCIAEWADMLPLKDSAIRGRLKKGWTPEQALSIASGKVNQWNRAKILGASLAS